MNHSIRKINIPRSTLPAITHIDYSARIQTVNERDNPRFYKLIKAFKKSVIDQYNIIKHFVY